MWIKSWYKWRLSHMKIELLICCSSAEKERCGNLEKRLQRRYGVENVEKKDGTYEHVVKTTSETYTNAENIIDDLYENSNGEIALIDYNVVQH